MSLSSGLVGAGLQLRALLGREPRRGLSISGGERGAIRGLAAE